MKNYRLCAMNSHYRFYTLEYFFQKAQENGFNAVELWTSPHHFFIDYADYDNPTELKKTSEKYGLSIICICPEQTNPKPNNIAISGEKQQQRVYQYYKNIIDTAKAVSPQGKVLITPGWCFYDEDPIPARNRSIAMLKQLADYAVNCGITLALEALQYDESLIANSCRDLKLIYDAVDSPGLKICIDFGAMGGAGDTLEDYFNLFGQSIVHCHFVDGTPAGHLAWGDGSRDMAKDLAVLDRYEYNGYLSLETAASRYFKNPAGADRQSLKLFQQRIRR